MINMDLKTNHPKNVVNLISQQFATHMLLVLVMEIVICGQVQHIVFQFILVVLSFRYHRGG